MKNRLVISSIAGLAILGSGAVVATNAYAQARPVRSTHQTIERHPDLQRALSALHRAYTNLNDGARDFGGHRAAAERLTNQAIEQVQQALRDDKH